MDELAMQHSIHNAKFFNVAKLITHEKMSVVEVLCDFGYVIAKGFISTPHLATAIDNESCGA